MSKKKWRYLPGCPCERCERYRWENKMTVHAVGAKSWPEHMWEWQAKYD